MHVCALHWRLTLPACPSPSICIPCLLIRLSRKQLFHSHSIRLAVEGTLEAKHFCRLIGSVQRWTVLQISACECPGFNLPTQHGSHESMLRQPFLKSPKFCFVQQFSVPHWLLLLILDFFSLSLFLYPIFLVFPIVSASCWHLLLCISFPYPCPNPSFSFSVILFFLFPAYSHYTLILTNFYSGHTLQLTLPVPVIALHLYWLHLS